AQELQDGRELVAENEGTGNEQKNEIAATERHDRTRERHDPHRHRASEQWIGGADARERICEERAQLKCAERKRHQRARHRERRARFAEILPDAHQVSTGARLFTTATMDGLWSLIEGPYCPLLRIP